MLPGTGTQTTRSVAAGEVRQAQLPSARPHGPLPRSGEDALFRSQRHRLGAVDGGEVGEH
jgi:hypothetical protein